MIRIQSMLFSGSAARYFVKEAALSFRSCHCNADRLTIRAASQTIYHLLGVTRSTESTGSLKNVDSGFVKYNEIPDHSEGIQGDIYSVRLGQLKDKNSGTELSSFPEGFQAFEYHGTWNKQGEGKSLNINQAYGRQYPSSTLLQWHSRRLYSTEQKEKESAPESGHTTSAQVESPNTPLSQKDKLKRAVKEYGATVIVFHVCISLMSLGGFYVAVSSGIDMVALLSKMGVGESILQSKAVAGAGTFVAAYAVHKVFAPVRIAITLTSTPFIVRYLRGIGFLKPPKPKV